MFPTGQYCRLGGIGLWKDTTIITRVSEINKKIGLVPGDLIIGINNIQVGDTKSLLQALRNNQEGENITVTVLWWRNTLKIDTVCVDGRKHFEQITSVLQSQIDKRWGDCVRELENIEGIIKQTAMWSSMYFSCNSMLAKLSSNPQAYDHRLAAILYDVARKLIEEAEYVPDGIDSIRGDILAEIHRLETWNYQGLADDLKTLLKTAGQVNPRLDIPEISSFVSIGTCFAVTPNGKILTSHHIIKDADTIFVYFSDGHKVQAKIEAASAANDLVLLSVLESTPNYLILAPIRSLHLGHYVFTLGFPATSILGGDAKFNEGSISSLTGPNGEASYFQISVPIQPGNSGGPLVNANAEVVGINMATTEISNFLKITGTLPQNVNYAVNADYSRPLFEPPSKKPHQVKDRQEAIALVKNALCRVEASRK